MYAFCRTFLVMKEITFQKTHIRRFRFNDLDVEKMELLKQHDVKVSQFIREAFNEKFIKEFPDISKPKNELPF